MNIISLVVWTLERNCFTVYTALIVCFVGFTLLHKNKLETHYRSVAKKEKLARNNPARKGGGVGEDSDDDDEELVPALGAGTPHVAYRPPHRSDAELLQRSREYYELMAQRRTVRAFSTDPIPQEVLDNLIRTAGTSPSGAHTEPWTFVVVQDPKTKEVIREIVEEEEELNYARRMSRQWVADLKPFRTSSVKPYLTEAPALVLVFRQTHSWRPDGKKRMHYYSEISTAIAAGILLAAIQYCGLVALTSTPLHCSARLGAAVCAAGESAAGVVGDARLELLVPVGRAAAGATVPLLARKPLQQIMINI